MEFIEDLLGVQLGLPARFIIAFVFVLLLIALTAWIIRRVAAGRGGFGGSIRAKQDRLGVVDGAHVDAKRRLILIRRDNVEHLVLIGGPTDVLIESGIGALPVAAAAPAERSRGDVADIGRPGMRGVEPLRPRTSESSLPPRLSDTRPSATSRSSEPPVPPRPAAPPPRPAAPIRPAAASEPSTQSERPSSPPERPASPPVRPAMASSTRPTPPPSPPAPSSAPASNPAAAPKPDMPEAPKPAISRPEPPKAEPPQPDFRKPEPAPEPSKSDSARSEPQKPAAPSAPAAASMSPRPPAPRPASPPPPPAPGASAKSPESGGPDAGHDVQLEEMAQRLEAALKRPLHAAAAPAAATATSAPVSSASAPPPPSQASSSGGSAPSAPPHSAPVSSPAPSPAPSAPAPSATAPSPSPEPAGGDEFDLAAALSAELDLPPVSAPDETSGGGADKKAENVNIYDEILKRDT